MFNREDQTSHVQSLPTLISKELRKGRENERFIEHELSNFRSGHFDNIDNFKQRVLELVKEMEHGKLYTEEDEVTHLQHVEKLVHGLLSYHLGKDIYEKLKSLFDKALDKIIADLRIDMINERRLRRQRPPRQSILKRLMSDGRIQRQAVKDTIKERKLTDEEHELLNSIKSHASALAHGSKESWSLLEKEIKMLCDIYVDEFDIILEEEQDMDIQEVDLMRHIRELSQQKSAYQENFSDFYKHVSQLLKERVRKDVNSARRIYADAKESKRRVDHALSNAA